MLVRFIMSGEEFSEAVCSHTADRPEATLAEVIDDLRSQDIASGRSLWGIQSFWQCDTIHGGLVSVEIGGLRQSLRDWCPDVLLAAADAAHAAGRLLAYETQESLWRPSWSAMDLAPLFSGADVPTDWMLHCDSSPPAVGILDYVPSRHRLPVRVA